MVVQVKLFIYLVYVQSDWSSSWLLGLGHDDAARASRLPVGGGMSRNSDVCVALAVKTMRLCAINRPELQFSPSSAPSTNRHSLDIRHKTYTNARNHLTLPSIHFPRACHQRILYTAWLLYHKQ